MSRWILQAVWLLRPALQPGLAVFSSLAACVLFRCFFVTQGQKLGRNHGSLFELPDVVSMPDGVDAKRQFVTFEGCSGVDCRSGPRVS